jgi:RNA polymerase sigma factor (sigma-70 family)
MTTPADVLRHLRRQFGTATLDADLLRAYADRRDADAFRALVERHGPMILGVCRRRLGDDHAADDAFQATFLAFARNARGLRRPEALATWLYKVAVRICGRARRAANRRRAVERRAAPRAAVEPTAELTARELLDALDEELLALPNRYRHAIWLVYWQGLSHSEAAARLNLSQGTLHGRLDRGRKRLADRLRCRGFGPDAAARSLLIVGAGAVAVPGDLLARTVAVAAAPWSKALPTAIVVLAASAVPSKLVPMTALALVVVGGTIGLVASRGLERPEARTPRPPDAQVLASPNQPVGQPLRLDLHGDPLPPGAMARLGTVRMRHPGAGPVVVLPDGRSLASIGQTVKVWDLATGKLLREFGPLAPLHSSATPARPAISADRRWLVIPGLEALQVWDMTTGRLTYTVAENGPFTPVYAYSPDGRRLVSGSQNGKLTVRDAATGKSLRTSDAQRNDVRCLVFAGANTLVTGTSGPTLRVWDVATATIRRQFRTGHERGVAALAATADGRWLASIGEEDRKVRLWDLPAEREVAVFDVPFEYGPGLAFSPNGMTLAAAGWGGPVHLWDVATRRLRTLPLGRELSGGHSTGGLRSFAFSPDGRLIVGTDLGNLVRCLDVTTGRDCFASEEPAGPVRGLSFTADGRSVRVGCGDTFIRTYDLTGRLLKRQPAGYMVYFAPGGRTAVTESFDEWYLVDADTGRSWSRKRIGRAGLNAAAFTPDGGTVAVLTTLPDQPVGPQRIALSLVETATGRLLRTLDDAIFGQVLKYTADGRTLALVERKTFESGPFQESVHLWDAATGRTTGRIPLPKGWTSRDMALSPDGRLVAAPRLETAGARNPGQPPTPVAAWVAIFEVATGRERLRLRLEPTDYGDEIWSIGFAANGRDLLLGVDDGTVRIWDLASGRERHRLTTSSGSATALAVSSDGRLLASGHGDYPKGGGHGDGTVLLWPYPPAPERALVALPGDRPARDTLWKDLGSSDAARAGDILNRLAADPDGAIALIRERLAPAAAADSVQVSRWLADLDAPRFAARTNAAAELERLGELAEPALRKALAGTSSAEVKSQVERLLAKLDGLVEQADTLRGIRSVEVLERIATPDARALLVELAKGAPAARLTRQAADSLRRLK